MKPTKSCACYKIVCDCSISLKILTFSLKETMILGVIIMTRSWFKKKKKRKKDKKKDYLKNGWQSLYIHYVYNIFTILLQQILCDWLLLVEKKMISIVGSNYN